MKSFRQLFDDAYNKAKADVPVVPTNVDWKKTPIGDGDHPTRLAEGEIGGAPRHASSGVGKDE